MKKSNQMSQRLSRLIFVLLICVLSASCSHRVTLSLVHTLQGHEGAVHSLAFSPDGSLLVSGSADGTVKLWRVADGSEVRTMRGHQGPVHFVAFSADGKFVISRGDDRTIKGWQVTDGSMAWVLPYTSYAALWVTPERTILATSEPSAGVAQLWDIPRGTEIRALKSPCWWGSNSSIIPLTLSADGKWIAGYVLGTQPPFASCIALWRLDDDYQKMLPLPSRPSHLIPPFIQSLGFLEFVSSLAFSPNGRFLAAKLPYRIILWELEQGIIKDWPRILYVEERSLISDSFRNVTFSPDGTLLAGCDSEGLVRMWQVPEGKEVKRFMAEGCPVSFSPDGQLLASGSVKQESSETTIKIWKLHRP
jgi:WD40 repeat protein